MIYLADGEMWQIRLVNIVLIQYIFINALLVQIFTLPNKRSHWPVQYMYNLYI